MSESPVGNILTPIVWTERGILGICLSVADASHCFSLTEQLRLVLCVDPPRCRYVTCVAEAAIFFDEEKK